LKPTPENVASPPRIFYAWSGFEVDSREAIQFAEKAHDGAASFAEKVVNPLALLVVSDALDKAPLL
jgi:hypothetical protein